MSLGVVVIVLEIIAAIIGLVVNKKKPTPHTDTRAKVTKSADNVCTPLVADSNEVKASGDERIQRHELIVKDSARTEVESGDKCLELQSGNRGK